MQASVQLSPRVNEQLRERGLTKHLVQYYYSRYRCTCGSELGPEPSDMLGHIFTELFSEAALLAMYEAGHITLDDTRVDVILDQGLRWQQTHQGDVTSS